MSNNRLSALAFHQHSLKVHAARALVFCVLLPFTVAGGEILPSADNFDASFSLPDLSDRKQSLSDYHGRVVLVNFWATWCPPCIYEMPALLRLQKRFADQPFEILALNVGEKKYRVMKFVRLINFDLPVLLDTSSDTFNHWGVETLPTSFLVGADGHIRYKIRGDPDWENQYTLAVLEQLLSETAQFSGGQPAITDSDNDTRQNEAEQ